MTDEIRDPEEPPYNPATMAVSALMTAKVRRLKRPWVLLTLGIAIVVVVSIITDFPKTITKAQDASDQNATMKEINADLAPCVFALHESLTFLGEDARGQLTKSDLSQVPGLLVGDRAACSFASQAVYDLTNNIQVTETKAGKYIDRLVNVVTLWITNHALRAVDDVSLLFAQPKNQRIMRNLARQETELRLGRQQARMYVKDATRVLGIAIIEPNMPVPRPMKS
ncbi:MAG: hypothetical protein ACRDVC_07755 [Acidimicrobiales bacterium]